ncbi:MAG: SusC/RagA family TonB-linked outer membrane protein [Candidatus Marinimicrobia bacterium]|jgi:TonB-linked SusC/RagA family outer membrane protein|nr:SusC/RagA family TonB-linked outer membrane protein [Candidatus Neomarinimicrobiota bacterium]MBT4994122.1 SusC/RagA family TonB-linked outer membrane protein [Candidatus Neomarinimicrobiota bacterium]MBT5312675.1 SusC/RagA family TonB-linked outer membrane protein [Candidatus Neomarinimicrobiota bacterium]MBT7200228.1 SusC/RagA family TonB-linked outer membrane protein [Candidatus Neomarinimicrobiota bacterium]
MCRVYKLIYFSCLLFLTSSVFAVELIHVSGKVTDHQGNALPGANVMVVQSNYGAAAALDGSYELSIPLGLFSNGKVAFRAAFMGYKTSIDSLNYSGRSDIQLNFLLRQDVLGLEEVIVTGLGGLEEKRKLGVLIESVKPETAAKSGETNLVTALRGNVPGLEIKKTSGDAGTNAYFRIRGTGTISGGHEPLMVIDGSPVNSSTRTIGGDGSVQSARNRNEASSRTSDINIDDIASIEILKGAAASAIYGSRASNGVVLITTKSGKSGELEISYKSKIGISAINNDYPLQRWFGQGTGGERVQNSSFAWGSPLNTPDAPWFSSDLPEDKVYDHVSAIAKYGYNSEQNFSASGGSDRSKFYLSFSRAYEKSHWVDWEQYQDQVSSTYGHVPNRETPSDYLRQTIRLKGSHLLTENLTLASSISFIKVKTNNMARAHTTDGLGRGLLATPPDFNLFPYLNDSTQYHRSSTNEDADVPSGDGDHKWNNPFWVLFEMVQTQELSRAFGNMKLDYKPTDWSTISYNLGADFSNDKRFDLLPMGSYRNLGVGRLIHNMNNQLEWDANLIFNIDGNKLLGYPVKLTLGHNLNSRGSRTINTEGNQQNVMNYYNIDNYESKNPSEYTALINTESLFGQLTYDFRDYLFFAAALRRDGSSTFGPADREHFFKKLSGAWSFTENFTLPYLNFGKLRLAYGEAGEQPGVYNIFSGYDNKFGYFDGKVNLGSGGSYANALGWVSDSDLGNLAIRPERRSENEYGLDLEFFNSRFGLSATHYKAISNDVIFNMDVAPSTGSNSLTANGAVIENKGFELSVNGNLMERKNFVWSSRFLYASNDNLLKEMNGITGESAALQDPSNLMMDQLSKFTFTAPGHSIGEFRGYSWARFGYGIIATDKDENGNTISVDIDSVYAGQWDRNDVYIQRDGRPDVNWKNADGTTGSYLWSGYTPNPVWTGSIYNEVKIFNNLTFSSLIDISYGGYIVNYTKNKLNETGTHLETADRYHESFDDPNWEGYEAGVTTEWGKGSMSELLNNGHAGIGPGEDEVIKYDESFYTAIMGTTTDIINNIEDASYVKLREISLSYRLDSHLVSKIGLTAVDIRLSARDIFTWTKYSGWDPETNMMQNRISGEDYFNQPQTWGANLSINMKW